MKCHIWIIDLYRSEIFAIRNLEKAYLASFEMFCWRRVVRQMRRDRECIQFFIGRIHFMGRHFCMILLREISKVTEDEKFKVGKEILGTEGGQTLVC